MSDVIDTRKSKTPFARFNRIKDLRRSRGLSAEKLAEIMDVHRSVVTKLERGERRLSPMWLQRLAEAMDVPPEAIMVLDEPKLVWAPRLSIPDLMSWLFPGNKPVSLPTDVTLMPVEHDSDSVLAFNFQETGRAAETFVIDYRDWEDLQHGYYYLITTKEMLYLSDPRLRPPTPVIVPGMEEQAAREAELPEPTWEKPVPSAPPMLLRQVGKPVQEEAEPVAWWRDIDIKDILKIRRYFNDPPRLVGQVDGSEDVFSLKNIHVLGRVVQISRILHPGDHLLS